MGKTPRRLVRAVLKQAIPYEISAHTFINNLWRWWRRQRGRSSELTKPRPVKISAEDLGSYLYAILNNSWLFDTGLSLSGIGDVPRLERCKTIESQRAHELVFFHSLTIPLIYHTDQQHSRT
ncbi:hypothetical protein CBL_07250 [Carabus blaptoides fortunei]